MPHVVYALLCPIMTYHKSLLIDHHNSGLWMAVVSDCAASVGAFLLRKTFDCLRLWRLLSPHIETIRRLYLDIPLSGVHNASKLERLLQNFQNITVRICLWRKACVSSCRRSWTIPRERVRAAHMGPMCTFIHKGPRI